ncbi:MAG TPA: hypothetical protein VK388_09895 [Pyrinomonadaceae bacterium]|nr:hypothetical protein [Pyrinomonadaceae bacterium]
MTPSKKPKPQRREVSVISVPDARPDDGLFNPFKEAKAAESAQTPEQPQPIPTHPNLSQPDATQPNPIAAAKDFNRRHNSLDRDALPAGLFPGTSQKLYNALFLKTRGAIVPKRTIQATKRELMAWSNIRSKNTIAVNLNILTSIGWIKAEHDLGSHEGSLYEVFIYEELPNPTQPNLSQPNPTQKLGLDPTQFLGWVGLGKPDENKDTYAIPKTSFNTKEEKFDDEAFAELTESFRKITNELTGKSPRAADAAKWKELAEVLIAELRIAAARTTVSNVPAFLSEHLRRRLWKIDKKQAQAEGRELPDQPKTTNVVPNGQTCLDCNNTGWWYPNGLDKGVTRCKHLSLRDNSAE